MNNIDNNLYKKQKLEVFHFCSNNIKELTPDLLFKILGLKFFCLSFSIQEEEFLDHFLNIGFVKHRLKNKNLNYKSLKFKDENKFIELSYRILYGHNNIINIKKIKTKDEDIELNTDGCLQYKFYKTNKKLKLIKEAIYINYEVDTINLIRTLSVYSVSHAYTDKRKSKINNLSLYSIIEYPLLLNDLKISFFEPVYYNHSNGGTLKISQLVLNFPDKNLDLFNINKNKSIHDSTKFETFFSKDEIKLLNIILI